MTETGTPASDREDLGPPSSDARMSGWRSPLLSHPVISPGRGRAGVTDHSQVQQLRLPGGTAGGGLLGRDEALRDVGGERRE